MPRSHSLEKSARGCLFTRPRSEPATACRLAAPAAGECLSIEKPAPARLLSLAAAVRICTPAAIWQGGSPSGTHRHSRPSDTPRGPLDGGYAQCTRKYRHARAPSVRMVHRYGFGGRLQVMVKPNERAVHLINNVCLLLEHMTFVWVDHELNWGPVAAEPAEELI